MDRGYAGTAAGGGGVCPANRSTLADLKERGICRAVVTGRSLYSFRKAIVPLDLDIDYLIFSSGAGILRWKDQRLLRSSCLEAEDVRYIAAFLQEARADFMIQAPVPENHRFTYWSHGRGCEDFHRRKEVYRKWNRPLHPGEPLGRATQFVVVLPAETPLEPFHRSLARYSLIRATSPWITPPSGWRFFPGA